MIWVPIILLDERCKPAKAHEDDAGFDLVAACSAIVPAGVVMRVPLGVRLGLPKGWEAQVRPRSGLSLKGIWCAFGTVDSGFRGEVGAILANLTGVEYRVKQYDRVAQLVIQPIHGVALTPSVHLDSTARGERGFGSTGE